MVLSTGSTPEENRERLLDCGPELVLLDIEEIHGFRSKHTTFLDPFASNSIAGVIGSDSSVIMISLKDCRIK